MSLSPKLQELHDEAVRQGMDYYVDPNTGYRVITELGHRERGTCCGCGCRHCPFNHERVIPSLLRRKDMD